MKILKQPNINYIFLALLLLLVIGYQSRSSFIRAQSPEGGMQRIEGDFIGDAPPSPREPVNRQVGYISTETALNNFEEEVIDSFRDEAKRDRSISGHLRRQVDEHLRIADEIIENRVAVDRLTNARELLDQYQSRIVDLDRAADSIQGEIDSIRYPTGRPGEAINLTNVGGIEGIEELERQLEAAAQERIRSGELDRLERQLKALEESREEIKQLIENRIGRTAGQIESGLGRLRNNLNSSLIRYQESIENLELLGRQSGSTAIANHVQNSNRLSTLRNIRRAIGLGLGLFAFLGLDQVFGGETVAQPPAGVSPFADPATLPAVQGGIGSGTQQTENLRQRRQELIEAFQEVLESEVGTSGFTPSPDSE